MNIDNSLIFQLCEKAKQSLVKNQLASCLLEGKKIISKIYCNSYKYDNGINNCHAEANAIIDYYKTVKKQKKINLLVIRINKHNKICNARPCYECLDIMKKYNINKVYYSTDNEIIECENVKYMISIHYTSYYGYTYMLNNKLKKNKLDTHEEICKIILNKYNTTTMHNLNLFVKYNLSVNFPYYKMEIINNIANIHNIKLIKLI
jgi:deoxycytidylate deaminase